MRTWFTNDKNNCVHWFKFKFAYEDFKTLSTALIKANVLELAKNVLKYLKRYRLTVRIYEKYSPLMVFYRRSNERMPTHLL